MRVYVGFWLLVIALLVASIEGSVFIKVFTRFTEEIFASLISLIYIFESVKNMILVSVVVFGKDGQKFAMSRSSYRTLLADTTDTDPILGISKTSDVNVSGV